MENCGFKLSAHECIMHVSYVKAVFFNYFLFLGNKSVWSQV